MFAVNFIHHFYMNIMKTFDKMRNFKHCTKSMICFNWTTLVNRGNLKYMKFTAKEQYEPNTYCKNSLKIMHPPKNN